MPTEPESPAHYSIATLLDIARIPADRIPALLSELPWLLDEIRPLLAMVDALSPEQAELIARQLIWVDDGITDGSADEMTVTIERKPSSPPPRP